jgi:uncharacterized protein with ParB-like and HNH nuclease domain
MSENLRMIFKPEAKTVKSVFGDSDSYYRIPDYQRPYSWGAEQIEQLWDDLYFAMDENEETYFLGPIILIGPNDGFEVVDGQQRLTTLTILFCVLRDLHCKDDNTLKNSIKSLVDKKYRLRLITQQHYQNQFEKEVLENVAFPKEELTKKERERNKFINAALIFKEKLASLDKKEIRKLIDFILDRVIMITITCPNKPFAIKLFQILNTRGLDLNQSDLIKSYLYGKCQENERAQFISTWGQIEDISKQLDEPMTGLFTYYEYYLLAKNPKKSLYEELEKKFRSKNPNTAIYDFKCFVDCFREISILESKLLFSFYYLPNQVFWKAILSTAKVEEFKDFNGLCKELQKMYYSYWIAGYTSTKVKQLSFNILNWVKENKPLEYIKVEIKQKMNKDNTISRMAENINNDAYGNSWLKPLLVLVEYEQTDNSKIAFLNLDNKLHIDHILPEKWDSVKEWKSLWTEEQAEKWLNKIGNLTLLSGRKNIAQRNDPPKKKKEMYEKGHGGTTAFELSKKIITILERGWKENNVKERQEWMIKEIEKFLN